MPGVSTDILLVSLCSLTTVLADRWMLECDLIPALRSHIWAKGNLLSCTGDGEPM